MRSQSADSQQIGRSSGEPFFFWYLLALFLIVLIAFPAHAIINSNSLAPISALLHLHAISMGVWFALAACQAGLIRSAKVQLHRRLGAASILLVVPMLATGIIVSMQNAARTGDPRILVINGIAVAFFVILYALGLAMRKRGEWHKRFMAFAALALMGPAFGRVGYILNISEELIFACVLGFMFAVPIYDRLKHKAVQKPTWIALGVSAAQVVTIGVALSQIGGTP